MDRKLFKINMLIGGLTTGGFTKKKLAKCVGVSKSKLSMFLHGDLPLPAHVEERIIRKLQQEYEAVENEQQHLACG